MRCERPYCSVGAVRLLFVTQWFPPEPTRVPATIASSLSDRGVDVSILTGTPNFPTGEVAEGYSVVRFQRDNYDDLPVLHTPLYPSHDQSAARRIINYFSWAVSATAASLCWAPARRADVALVYSSPATAAIPAMTLRLLRGTPYVLLVEDLWPDSVTATGFFKRGIGKLIAVPILQRFVQMTYRLADHVAVISPGMRRVLIERGVREDKVSVVHNWVRDEPEQPLPSEANGVHFVYGGNLGRAQGLEVIIRALAELGDPGVKVSFVGNGLCRDELVALAKDLVPDQVEFLPRMELSAFQEIARLASALFVCLSADPLFDVTLPSKVQSTLAMGLPVIVSAGADARALVEAAGAGWTAAAGDVSALTAAMAQTRDAGRDERARRGASGRSWYERELSEDVNAGRLHALLTAAHERVSTTSQGGAR